MEILNYLNNQLSSFVFEMCEGKPPCIGYLYSKQIANNSLNMYNEIYGTNPPENSLKTLIIVSWLQDLYQDNLYTELDSCTKLIIDRFLKTVCTDEDHITLVKNILDNLSFEKDWCALANGDLKDLQTVLGDEGSKIRDVISDVVNIESLSDTGIKRCFICVKNKYPNVSPEDVTPVVVQFINSKLLQIKDKFIKTEPGRRDVVVPHNKLLSLYKV